MFLFVTGPLGDQKGEIKGPGRKNLEKPGKLGENGGKELTGLFRNPGLRLRRTAIFTGEDIADHEADTITEKEITSFRPRRRRKIGK